jgi:hypothetical protein
MNNTTRPTDIGNPPPVRITTGNGKRPRTVRPQWLRPAAERTGRRFNPVTIGFWLGGFALGMGGCLLGACLPYRHPVGVTISILWWGIYLGCLGASIGGLLGLWWDQTPASPPRTGASGHSLPTQVTTGAAAAEMPRSLPADRRDRGESEAY